MLPESSFNYKKLNINSSGLHNRHNIYTTFDSKTSTPTATSIYDKIKTNHSQSLYFKRNPSQDKVAYGLKNTSAMMSKGYSKGSENAANGVNNMSRPWQKKLLIDNLETSVNKGLSNNKSFNTPNNMSMSKLNLHLDRSKNPSSSSLHIKDGKQIKHID